tara:strand:+ start:2272 stop:2457 length:186 start_codon:yes stop_codon:yes gene_type:complete
MDKLKGKKTYLFGVISIVAAFHLLVTGAIETGQFVSILSTALVGMGIRHGIPVEKKPSNQE